MKSHVTNHKHQQFILVLEDNFRKLEEIPEKEKAGSAEKIAEFKNNKETLENIYMNYQSKLKELSTLLDDYDRVQQVTRIQLRKMQMWLKFIQSKLTKDFF